MMSGCCVALFPRVPEWHGCLCSTGVPEWHGGACVAWGCLSGKNSFSESHYKAKEHLYTIRVGAHTVFA